MTTPSISTTSQINAMASHVNNPERSDLTIVCARGAKLYAHELLLRPYSEFFRTALSAPMKERETRSIAFPEDEAGVILMMLSFLYTGDYDVKRGIEQLTKDNMRTTTFEMHLHIALVAERLMLGNLKALAKTRMESAGTNIAHWKYMAVIRFAEALYGPQKLVRSDVTLDAKRLFINGVLDGGQIGGGSSIITRTDIASLNLDHTELLYDMLTASQQRTEIARRRN